MSAEQKVPVITGASRGIGAALVKVYREHRCRVVATAKPSNDANIVAVLGDIADRKTAERVISEGVARFGRIDTLVNNAGIFIAKPFTKHTEGRLWIVAKRQLQRLLSYHARSSALLYLQRASRIQKRLPPSSASVEASSALFTA
jgi:NAD(P)-dependent dehydrogenase (short-subunit alcohol dehydrogenase family)